MANSITTAHFIGSAIDAEHGGSLFVGINKVGINAGWDLLIPFKQLAELKTLIDAGVSTGNADSTLFTLRLSSPYCSINYRGGVGAELSFPFVYASELQGLINSLISSYKTLEPIDFESKQSSDKSLVSQIDRLSSIAVRKQPSLSVGTPNGMLISYGHSFLAEGSSAGVATADYYGRKLAKALGLVYPTQTVANDLKRAVGGSDVVDAEFRMIGTAAPWVPGTKAVVIIQSLINTLGVEGATTVALQTARNAIRSMCAMASAESRIEHDNVLFTYTGTWTLGTTSQNSAGSRTSTQTLGAKFEFAAPNADSYILMLGKSGGAGSGPSMLITDVTTSTVLFTQDLSEQIAPSLGSTIHAPFKIPAALVGHTIRVEKTDTSGATRTLPFDVLLPQLKNPYPIILVKEPYLPDYSLSVSFPFRSDAAIDAFNAIIDEVAAEFPNVIPVDLNGTYWDRKDVVADGTHPDVAGNQAITWAILDAISAWSARRQIALAFNPVVAP